MEEVMGFWETSVMVGPVSSKVSFSSESSLSEGVVAEGETVMAAMGLSTMQRVVMTSWSMYETYSRC
jgi:hypothetical protein